MKRIIAGVLALLLLLSVTACGNTGRTDSESASSHAASDMASSNVSSDATDSTSSKTQDGSSADIKEIESELLAQIPGLDVLPTEDFEWIEKDGYGALILHGVEEDPDNLLFNLMKAEGYSGGSNYGWDAKEISYGGYQKWENGEATQISFAYCGITDTLVLANGEVPSRYTCLRLAGLTEEELGEPKFEGRVYDFVPKTNGQAIHFSYTDYRWKDEQGLSQACDVTVRRLDSFISFMEDYGYERVTYEKSDDTSAYYEGRILAYRDLNMYVTMQAALKDGKLQIAVSAPGSELTKDEMWAGAAAYEGDKDGVDPDAPPMDGYPVIDLSNAQVSEEKGSTAYRFENIEYTESVLEYVKNLKAQGYNYCDFWYDGYEADTFSGSIFGSGSQYNIFESLSNGTDYMFVSYYNGRLLVLKSDQMITWSELELCAAVGMPYVPSTNYLLGTAQEVLQGYGQAYDTAGHAAIYLSGADAAQYGETVKTAQGLGFTNVLSESQNGNNREFHAWKKMPEGSYYTTLYVHIFLVGDYLEAQVSFDREAEIMGE